MKPYTRRTFLKTTLAGAVIGALGTALLKPIKALAAQWPKTAFESKKLSDALKNLYGDSTVTPSDAIKVKAPPVAENGATVPITVSSSLPNAQSIAILVEKNNQPLSTSIDLLANADAYLQTSIKMGESSKVHCVVKAGGKLYGTTVDIKVTAGGCGG